MAGVAQTFRRVRRIGAGRRPTRSSTGSSSVAAACCGLDNAAARA